MIIFRKSDRKTCFYKWPDNPNIYDWESSLGLTGLGICQSSSSLIWYDVELEDRPHSSQPQSYFQTPEVAYVDAQRNCAVALGERDVKTDVWNKESFNFLHLSDVSIVLSWLVRFECPPYRQGERDSAPGRPQETLLTCIWARWERGRDSGSFTVINITQAGSNLTSPGQAKRTLFYLSKAVEMNNYDENAFVSRSRYKNVPANNSGEIYLDAIICWDVTERQ